MVQRTKEILFVILVILSVVSAWLVGGFRRNATVGQVLETVMPEAHNFEKAPANVYIGLVGDGNDMQPVGYVGLSSANGRLGPVELAAGFDNTGLITSVALVNPLQRTEVSPQVLNGVLTGFVGKHYSDPLMAASSSEWAPQVKRLWDGLAEVISGVGHNVARVQGKVLSDGYKPRRWFGFPEFILILLYAVGYLAYRERSPYYQHLHWAVLIASLLFVGFWFKHPMSLEHLNSFLMGYWPSWQTHLYWYLLIGGVLVPIILTGRSFYCSHVCPFGATQKILKALGPKTVNLPEQVDVALRWLQRTLVWLAVICALVVRNPAVVRYDVSRSLFGFTGITWQFILLAAVLIASLMITRPWCNYLCPIRALTDFINLFRRAVRRVRQVGSVTWVRVTVVRRCLCSWIAGLIIMGGVVVAGESVVTSPSLEQLAHPVLTSEQAVHERLDWCYRQLETTPDLVTAQQTTVKDLSQLFVWFADTSSGIAPGELRTLDLSVWQSPAVKRLVRDVGLPVPPGYVFVRIYDSLVEMPAPIRAPFERQPHTQAVTFLSRYVAVRRDTAGTLPPSLRDSWLQQVLEHELVHVMLNSHLGVEAGRLPLWFHEGCAVIFSGQSGSQLVGGLAETPTGLRLVTYQWTLAADYRDYRRLFVYLQARLGKDAFYQQIHRMIDERTVRSLLSHLDVTDESSLLTEARRWHRRRENILWAGASCLLLVLVVMGWRHLPRRINR